MHRMVSGRNLPQVCRQCARDVYDSGTVSVKAPDVEASVLKIIVTGATDGCDVALGSIEVAGSWKTEGVKVACESDDLDNNEDQEDQKKIKKI